MGFWSNLFGTPVSEARPNEAQIAQAPHLPAYQATGGVPVMDPGFPLDWAWTGGGMRVNPAQIWRSQPSVRKVTGFIARNVAGVPLNVFDRVSDTDRQRVHDSPLADLLKMPRPRTSSFRFWEDVFGDWLLYDKWAVVFSRTSQGDLELVQVPSWRLHFEVDAFRRVSRILMWTGEGDWGDKRGWKELPLDSTIFDHGYAPNEAGLSPMETLADILAERYESIRYQRQIYENGARIPLVLKRPAGVEWTPEARQRFAESWKANYASINASRAGGTPVLEDGMEPHELRHFNPTDLQAMEARKLTDIEVASAFHIAPEMVGARVGSYASLRELRRRLYQTDLAPYIESWEGVLNAQLVPLIGDSRNLYVEANVESKLRGDFFEQATVKSRSVGGPWLTRNEARAMENRAPVPGGDELITPLNVTAGGQASPVDSGGQNITDGYRVGENARKKSRQVLVKASVSDEDREELADLLAEFFARQGRSVVSLIGAGRADWWDRERWDRELAETLEPVLTALSELVGMRTVRELGYPASDWSTDRTRAWWAKVAQSTAEAINITTQEQVLAALADDDGGPVDAVSHVFQVAEESRAVQAGISASTMAAGFGATEAARQIVQRRGGRSWKTWIVTSANPRPEHAVLDGETVRTDDTFSNGLLWPGDSGRGTVDQIAGCQCELEITIRED